MVSWLKGIAPVIRPVSRVSGPGEPSRIACTIRWKSATVTRSRASSNPGSVVVMRQGGVVDERERDLEPLVAGRDEAGGETRADT